MNIDRAAELGPFFILANTDGSRTSSSGTSSGEASTATAGTEAKTRSQASS